MPASDIFFLLLSDPNPPSAETAAVYLEQADTLIRGYLALDALPTGPSMDNARAMLALVLYNRRGVEGELKRAEGDVVSWFEALPEIIRLQLRPFRNARAVSWPPAPEAAT